MSTKEVIRAFTEVTMECFESMIDTKLKVKKAAYANNRFKQNGVYSLIGISGDLQGTIAISFEIEVAYRVLSQFLGEAVTSFDDQACDAAGEIINIIAGGKSRIEGHTLTMSLPSVMVGEPLIISLPKDVPVVAVHFDAPKMGEVILFICLAPIS